MLSITTDQARGITARGEGGAVLISVIFITLRKCVLIKCAEHPPRYR